MAGIRQVITTESGQSQREIEKLNRQMVKLREQMKRTAQEGKRGNDEQSTGIAKMTSGLAGMAAGWMSVSAAIGQAKQSYQEYSQFQQQAAQTHINVAKSELALFQNTVSMSDGELSRVRNAAARISENYPVEGGRGAVNMALASSISSAGGLSLDSVIRGVGLAAQTSFGDPASLQATAGGINTAQRVLGVENPERALGFLLSVQGRARIESLQATSQNLLPSIRSIAAFGGTPTEAAALTTALGSRIEDASGRLTGTSSINLATQLQQALPQMGSTAERIRFLQGNERLRQQFLGGLSIERQMMQPVAELLTPGSQVASQFEADIAGIGDPARGAQRVNTLLSRIGGSGVQQVAAMDRLIAGATETAIVNDLAPGEAGVIQSRLNALLQSQGLDYFSRTQAYIGFNAGNAVGMDPVENFFGELRNIRNFTRALIASHLYPDNPSDAQLERLANQLETLFNNFKTQGTQGEGVR